MQSSFSWLQAPGVLGFRVEHLNAQEGFNG